MQRVKFEFDESSRMSLEKLKEQGAIMPPIHEVAVRHEETSEGIQAALQEIEEIAEKLRFKCNQVLSPGTNLETYFRGKLLAYDAAVEAVARLSKSSG
jgi:hypothetical protein